MSMLEDFQRLMQVEDEPSTPAQARPPPFHGVAVLDDRFSLGAFVRASHAVLAEQLIALIHAQTPEFFETLVLDVLEKMLNGKRRPGLTRRLGQSGDGGIDGIIALDALGLDQVYFQAKRLRPGTLVPIADVRDFAGALEAKHAGKGVFVATADFSAGAIDFCARLSRRVVLIDGSKFADLMIGHNIGVKVKESIELKRVDADYFTARCAMRRNASTPSAGRSLSY